MVAMAADLIDRYRARLRINKHALDDALEEQAHTLEEINRYAVLAEADAERAKATLESTVAQVTRDTRQDEPKTTVDYVNAVVALHADCRKAKQALIDARQRAEEWQALAKAWYARGFDLKALAELYAADYFSLTQVSAQPTVAARFADIARRDDDVREGRRPRRRDD